MEEIKKRPIPLYQLVDCGCKGEGGVYDCGWWYECPCQQNISNNTKETNEQRVQD